MPSVAEMLLYFIAAALNLKILRFYSEVKDLKSRNQIKFDGNNTFEIQLAVSVDNNIICY